MSALRAVQNAAARLVTRRREHITTVLRQLHWLLVRSFTLDPVKIIHFAILRQCARMSKIKNGGLDQYGAEPFERQQFGTAGTEGVKLAVMVYKALNGLFPQ